MRIQDALNTGRLIRRPEGGCTEWGTVSRSGHFLPEKDAVKLQLSYEDIIAADWEIQAESRMMNWAEIMQAHHKAAKRCQERSADARDFFRFYMQELGFREK